MSWLDDVLKGLGGLGNPMPPESDGNLVRATLGLLDKSPTVAAARSPTGSLDPNRIKAAMPKAYASGLDPLIDTGAALHNLKMQGVEEAYKKPESSWIQGIGRALSAASVPVAYWQGNNSYGQGMLGRTEQDLHNRRMEAYDDRLAQARAGGAASFYDQLGSTAMDYIGKTNDRQREALLQARRMVAAAERTGNPQAIAEAKKIAQELLEAQGVTERTGATAVHASAPGTMPSGVPGTVMTPPTGAPGAAASQAPTALPVSTPAAPPMPASTGAPSTAVNPRAQLLRDQAAYLAEFDPKAAKAALDEAERLEEPAQKGRIKYAEESAKNAAALAEQARAAAAAAPAITKSLDRLMDTATSKNFPESAIGTVDSMQIFGSDRTVGDLRQSLTPWADEASHVKTRQSMKNELKFLAIKMKDFVRKEGDGPWTDYDQQNLEDLASGGAAAQYDQAGLVETLNDLKTRIQTTLMDPVNVKLPPGRTSVEGGAGAQRTSTADARVREVTRKDPTISYKQAVNTETGERMILVDGEWIPYDKSNAVEIPLSRDLELKRRRQTGRN